MTDAKLIDPSDERVANTAALLLRFNKDYEKYRTNGPETDLTVILEQLSVEDKKQLYLKACETIAEMDEAMKETPSLKERAKEFLQTHDFKDIANSALRAATEARQAFNRTKLAAKEAASQGMDAAQEAASKGMDKLNEIANSEEVTAAKENLVKGKDAAKETISRGLSGLSSMYNKVTRSQGGKRKNKTKKLTKKEKKMKKARK